MTTLKVIKHEIVKGKLLVTVEVKHWWRKPYTRQFIESGYCFEKHPNEDPAWFNYPDFTTVGWWSGLDANFHKLLTSWKRKYNFFKTAEDGK